MKKLAHISLHGGISRHPDSDTYFLWCFCARNNLAYKVTHTPLLSMVCQPLIINTGIKEIFHKPITREDIPPGYFRYGY